MQKFTKILLRTLCLLVILICTSYLEADAQTNTVTGIVSGKDDGSPIPGVTVVLSGTNQGVATDANGKFSINAPIGSTLDFNLIGYQKLSAKVTGPTLNISLETKQNNLNEVVVIGYGTVKKKDLTGAIANIKGSDIKSQGVSDVTKALQGKLPGVTIEAAGGNPGSGTRILIRGVGSLNNATPLYLVDGVQVANINNLSQNDIQSIDILKDASAAAIYGSRAANGVVLVTTKTGKNGKTIIQANANYGVQNIEHKVDVLNAEQWATVSNAAHDAAGLARLDIAANPQSLGAGTNWQNAIYRSAPIQQYDLLMSGGNETSNFSVSGSFLDQDGIVKVTGYNRYNLRAKSETSKGPFKFGETIILTREKTINMPGGWGGQGGNPVGSAAKMIPAFGIYDATAIGGFAGATGPVVNVANPIAQLNLEDIDRVSSSILTNAYGQLTILPGLTYKLNFGYTSDFGTGTDYYKRYVVGTLFSHPTNDLSISKDQNNLLLLENTLNYTKVIGKHSIQALAGYTYQKTDYTYLLSARTDLPDGLENIDAGAGTSTTGGNSIESSLVSALGRIIYSYDDRYLLTASIRRDGSSRFGSNNKYGNFPSIALGWNVSNEKFYGQNNVLSTLKLRASYGELGNQEIGDYQYSAAVASNINYVTGTSQQKWFGAIQTSFADPNIKWENTKTVNAGFDAGFFHDKLFLTADYFIKTTDDVLLNVPIPGSAGSTSNPVVNAGKLRNNGIELGLNYTDNIGKLKYNVFGTLSAVKNKVLELGTGTQQIFGGQPTHHGASSTLTEANGPITGFYLIKDVGIFQSDAEVSAYKDKKGNVIQPNAHAGDIKFLDANGDGQINDQDKVFMGSPFPNFEYGFGFNLSYHSFDVNAFFQGTQGNKIYNGLRQDLESMSLEFNYSTTTLKAWTPQNTNTTVPRAVIDDPNFNDQTSSRFLESGSYLRLKTLQVGYTLGDVLKRKLKINSLRVYVSGDNVFTITKYTGFNPDLGRTGSIFDRGVDFGHVAYPLARTFSIGLQLGL